MSGAESDLGALSGVLALGPERTVEQTLARELRAAIVDGRLAPGTRLPYRDLAHQFEVSVTPVRIALRELAQEGLVVMRPHEGARVTPLSARELEEIYAARTGFEGWLARQGAPRLGGEDLAAMERALGPVEAAAADGDRDVYLSAVWALRRTCYRAAGRPDLLARVEALYARSARYNWLTLSDASRLRESLAGARAFAAACRDRDGARARECVRDALDRTMEHLLGRFVEQDSPPQTRPARGGAARAARAPSRTPTDPPSPPRPTSNPRR
jgi:DNA-binding GntR family transcriptional regulator